VLFQRLAIAGQSRLAGGGVDRHRHTGDLPVPLAYQVLHGTEGRRLLLEEHAALPGLADVAVDRDKRHLHAVDELHDRFFAHVAGIKHDGIALAIGQHLHRFLFPLRGIVTVGDNQLFAVRFGLTRGLLQQAAKVKTVKGRDHQTNAVAGPVRQRSRQKIGAIAQLFHRVKHLLTGTLFDLTCAVQYARHRGFRHARAQ